MISEKTEKWTIDTKKSKQKKRHYKKGSFHMKFQVHLVWHQAI